MSPLLILLVGMAVVIGGVLALRLHAFLVLIVGALIVSALTPRDAVYRTELKSAAVPFTRSAENENEIELGAGTRLGLQSGARLAIFRASPLEPAVAPTQIGLVEVIVATEGRATARLVPDSYAEQDIALEPSDLVVPPLAAGKAASAAGQSFGDRIATGFGDTCLSIGILIALAAIIGKCLLESGAAERIVLSIRRAVGEERAPQAFLASGFIVGIPVFFDTVFYLLMPLGKAMRVRTGRNYLLYVLTIVAGGTMAHSLVPPTPGPLFVASQLNVDIGVMMIAGCVIGLFTSGTGYLYALWANRRWEVPLRESAELTAEELAQMAGRDEDLLPPLWMSLLPIALPVVLIAGKAVIDMLLGHTATKDSLDWIDPWRPWINHLGNKNIALAVATLAGLLMLVRQKKSTRAELAVSLQTALAGGGVIILITAAGGAFGKALQQTGIAEQIGTLMPSSQANLLLPLAFFITATVRIAQGSATVAMITSVGIVGPLAAAASLPFHPVYLALAIGCGSKPIPWMNDSGFWVISRMSGMTEGETLKTVSVMMTLMGIVGLALTILAAQMLPLA